MRNILKHKGEVKKEVKDNSKKILKTSFEALGCNELIDDMIIKTYDGHEFYCFKFSYLNPNGVEDEVDKKNHFLMRQLLNSISKRNKLFFVNETKNNLNANIEFYEKRLKEDISMNVKQSIINRIELMKIFNDEKYVSMFIWVEPKDKDIFLKMSNEFLDVELICGTKLIDLLDILNNEMK